MFLGRWGTFSINEGRTGRCARVVCWDKSTNETTVSKVALGTKGAVLSHDVIPGAYIYTSHVSLQNITVSSQKQHAVLQNCRVINMSQLYRAVLVVSRCNAASNITHT
jgi:hypothetical protein